MKPYVRASLTLVAAGALLLGAVAGVQAADLHAQKTDAVTAAASLAKIAPPNTAQVDAAFALLHVDTAPEQGALSFADCHRSGQYHQSLCEHGNRLREHPDRRRSHKSLCGRTRDCFPCRARPRPGMQLPDRRIPPEPLPIFAPPGPRPRFHSHHWKERNGKHGRRS